MKEKDKEKDKGKKLDRPTFKKAIATIESADGKYMSNPNSSAAGSFLYRYIRNTPLLKGVSKREFMNREDLQEKVMDMAIEGTLPGFKGYELHAKELKTKYNTPHSIEHIAALTHFLGATGVQKYIRDPKGFKVPGKNASVNQYISRFNDAYQPPEGEARAEQPVFLDKEKDKALQPVQPKQEIRVPSKPGPFDQTKKGFMDQFTELTNIVNDPGTFVQDFVRQYKGEPTSEDSDFVNEKAMGGQVSGQENGIVEIENGGTHEQNPYGGVPMGMGQNGKPNTVEEGEVKFGDYMFSNRLLCGGHLKIKK
jgi:hypothetical protein